MLNKKVEIFRDTDLQVITEDNIHYQVWVRNRRKPERDKLVLPNTSKQTVITILEKIKEVKKSLS